MKGCKYPRYFSGRQRFVVLCEGCMYLYKDEYATSPLKAFSLADFTRYYLCDFILKFRNQE